MEGETSRRASFLPLSLFIMAIAIIAVGGSIRINDAGESCPEWPTCFGSWHFDVSPSEQAAYWDDHPEQIDSRGELHRYSTFQIFVEWFHRLLVGIIAIPILLNVLYTKRTTHVYGEHTFHVASLAGLLLILQAFAGYVTVRFDNADWTVALHLVLACSFAGLLLWQYMSMRIRESVKWKFLTTPPELVQSHFRRVFTMAISVGILLVLGAWVASSAGGNYNQSCSVGFPEGWPQCQGSFLPSFDEPGVFVQLIHRFGAVIVGLILVMNTGDLRRIKPEHTEIEPFVTMAELTAGIWVLNVLVGGSYIVFAKIGDFPEWLSLLHLIVGVSAFLVALTHVFMVRFCIMKGRYDSTGSESE